MVKYTSAYRRSGKSTLIVSLVLLAVFGLGTLAFVSQKIGNKADNAEVSAQDTKATNLISDDVSDIDTATIVPEIIPGDPVVAKIGDQEVKRSDVMNFIRGFPPQLQQLPVQQLFPMALDQLVNERLVRMNAGKAKLDKDPEVKKRLEEAKSEIIATVFLKKKIEENISETDLQAAYEEHIAGHKDKQEANALHILVKDKKEAHDLIQQLEKGADFKELAKEHSQDKGSAVKGGDIGYFTADEVVPEFADAAFALEKGAHSFDPVKSQFGYHIIKLIDKRARPVPSMDDVKPLIEGKLRQQSMAGLFEKWREKGGVKVFDINGNDPNAQKSEKDANKDADKDADKKADDEAGKKDSANKNGEGADAPAASDEGASSEGKE